MSILNSNDLTDDAFELSVVKNFVSEHSSEAYHSSLKNKLNRDQKKILIAIAMAQYPGIDFVTMDNDWSRLSITSLSLLASQAFGCSRRDLIKSLGQTGCWVEDDVITIPGLEKNDIMDLVSIISSKKKRRRMREVGDSKKSRRAKRRL